jgi:DNA-binding NarL/FixJ family response regulator
VHAGFKCEILSPKSHQGAFGKKLLRENAALTKRFERIVMKPIRILLADDHLNVRTQIRARLGREPGFEIVGEATNSEQAVNFALKTKPHVVLIDPIMRDGRGVVAVSNIAEQLPHTAIIVLTAYSDTILQMELRKIGVGRILDKGIESERLVEIIRKLGESDSHTQTQFPQGENL